MLGGRFCLVEFRKLDRGPGPSVDKRIGPDDADELIVSHGFVRDILIELGEFTYLTRYVKV